MSDFTVKIVRWCDESDRMLQVRKAVFIGEQNVPEDIEFDGRDPECCHVLAIDSDGRAVGTARLDKTGKLGRMAVLASFRKRGIGTRMLDALLECGRKNGIRDFRLNAQLHAVEFYRKAGFEPSGPTFLEAGIEHIRMKKA